MIVNSENHDENQKPSPAWSGEHGIAQDTTESGGTRIAVRTTTVPHLVERVTALRGQSIARPQEPKSVCRRQTRSELNGNDPEIPYVKFEAAIRDLVCSLMERQDRMNEEIFYKINDLAYRVEDLEQDRTGNRGGK